nr:hypothetical protein OG513_07580 [Streptomyces sp. NBC_00998]
MTYAVFAENGAVCLARPFSTQEAAGEVARTYPEGSEAGEECPWHAGVAYDSCPGD